MGHRLAGTGRPHCAPDIMPPIEGNPARYTRYWNLLPPGAMIVGVPYLDVIKIIAAAHNCRRLCHPNLVARQTFAGWRPREGGIMYRPVPRIVIVKRLQR